MRLVDRIANGTSEVIDLKKNPAKNWTKADDELLRSLAFKGVDARLIGKELNRSASAVRSRANRLDILLKKTFLYQLR
jgi:hypothetical protein